MAEMESLDIPVRLTFHNMERSEHLAHQAELQARKLERFKDQIIDVRILLDAAHKGSQSTDFLVKVEVSLRGGTVVGQAEGRPHHALDNQDAYKILREAFDNTLRRLDAHIAKHHKPVKPPRDIDQRRGTVTRIDPERGNGMLETDQGQSLFFHAHAVKGETLADLAPGMVVTYTVAEAVGAYGPEAASVSRVVGGG